MRYFFDTITTKAYWQYSLLSKEGLKTIFAVFGLAFLLAQSLDFFNIVDAEQFGVEHFIALVALSFTISFWEKRPVTSITVRSASKDYYVEVRVGDLLEADGAIVISSNEYYESDVAGGKISKDSLQGQFTLNYFAGNQTELSKKISEELATLGLQAPFPMGTVIQIPTHGKIFYFLSMAHLNESGNAYTSYDDLKASLKGLWHYVSTEGELQELSLPVLGTGRGRLKMSREEVVSIMVNSFKEASRDRKLTEHLTIYIREADARNFGVNLWELKDRIAKIL